MAFKIETITKSKFISIVFLIPVLVPVYLVYSVQYHRWPIVNIVWGTRTNSAIKINVYDFQEYSKRFTTFFSVFLPAVYYEKNFLDSVSVNWVRLYWLLWFCVYRRPLYTFQRHGGFVIQVFLRDALLRSNSLKSPQCLWRVKFALWFRDSFPVISYTEDFPFSCASH